MPVTDVFEAEIQVHDLPEFKDKKTIMTRGYTCMMHIHTFSDEVVIKDFVKAWETIEGGDPKEKDKPKFVKS